VELVVQNVQKIEEIMKAERESMTDRLSKLTKVATLFQERANLTLNAGRSHKASLFQQDEITSLIEVELTTNGINSREELEKVLIEIIKANQGNFPKAKLSVAKLGTGLRKASGQTPNSIVKKLKLGSSFTKFLHLCPTFKLEKTDKEYEITVAQP